MAPLAASALAASAGIALGAAARPHCLARQLAIHYGGSDNAADSVLAEYSLTNHGSASCTLRGYPRVQMLKRSGRPLATIDRRAAAGFDGISVRSVLLAPGKRAWFGIFYADQTGFGRLHCPAAGALRFALPNGGGALSLHGSGAHIAPYGTATSTLRCGLVRLTPVSAKPLFTIP